MSPTSLRLLLLACVLCFPAAILGRQRPWEKLENCRLVQKTANDGDSFHVHANEKDYIFRLLFVDAAETDRMFPERVEAQAKYFRLSIEETLQVGKEARRFTEKTLSHRTFTVWTRMDDARGQSRKKRYFGFVLVGDKDLGGELVANGLARVHGYGSRAPGTSPIAAQWNRLKRLEEIAKSQKVGAWGFHSGGLQKRVESKERIDPDAFDQFFHPEKKSQSPLPDSNGSDRSATSKLDINNASQAELENIPGIGPALAQWIMAARPFKTADDLRNVKGIKGKKYEKIRPYFN